MSSCSGRYRISRSANGLHGDANVLGEADRVRNVEAVESVTVTWLAVAAAQGIAQEGGSVVAAKAPGPAEVVFGAGATDGGELAIAIEENLELPSPHQPAEFCCQHM